MSNTYFVSRHPGFVGTLPIHLAARVCEPGTRYVYPTLNLPAELRGQALSADHLEALGASLQAFEVTPLHHPKPQGLLQP